MSTGITRTIPAEVAIVLQAHHQCCSRTAFLGSTAVAVNAYGAIPVRILMVELYLTYLAA